ncbi:MAG: CDP-glucose 4,6-dehydratase [Methanobacteriaceae archaeon]
MKNFYKGKKVLITGHNGFKGTWLSKILINWGANVTGYSLEAPTKPSLFDLISLENNMNSVKGDIRDLNALKSIFNEFNPEIIIHMAAQPLVRDSYKNPVYTYETNVIGTVNILECFRDSDLGDSSLRDSNIKSFLNVTTDKVYENKEWLWPYRENENLCGHDPYSNSKSCSELVTYSYKNSFFNNSNNIAISTARSGNVIGGGDFAKDRIIPDCVKSAERNRLNNNEYIEIRNPNSTRPYQHVLECLSGYLLLAKKQYEDKSFEGSYNFGPNEESSISTGNLVDIFCNKWGEGLFWKSVNESGPHEANFLKLDCSKAKSTLDWIPKWDINMAVDKVVEWTKIYLNGGNVAKTMDNQINDYFE